MLLDVRSKFLDEKIEDFLIDIIQNKTDFLDKIDNLKKLNYQNTWINVNQKILNVVNENWTSKNRNYPLCRNGGIGMSGLSLIMKGKGLK